MLISTQGIYSRKGTREYRDTLNTVMRWETQFSLVELLIWTQCEWNMPQNIMIGKITIGSEIWKRLIFGEFSKV